MNEFKGILSLLIFCVELVLLINVSIFSKSKFKKELMIMLALLSFYQLFEFLICGMNFNYPMILYLAFISITFLPPTGLSLVLNVNRIKLKKYKSLIFAPAIFFSLFYFILMKSLRVKECTLIYAIYHYPLGFLYGLFYYLPIITAIFILINYIIKSEDRMIKRQNLILLIGYLAFIFPMVFVLIINPEAREFIESLMCKFAFGLALILSYFALYFKK